MQNRAGRIIFAYPAQTGRLQIDYVDYAVAKTLETVVDQWFSSLRSTKQNSLVIHLQYISSYFPNSFKFITAAAVSICRYLMIDNWATVAADDKSLMRFGVVAFSIVFVSSGIAFMLGQWAERAIDDIQPISYLNLNKGDERIHGIALSNNRNLKSKATLAIVGTLALNIVAAYLAKILGI